MQKLSKKRKKRIIIVSIILLLICLLSFLLIQTLHKKNPVSDLLHRVLSRDSGSDETDSLQENGSENLNLTEDGKPGGNTASNNTGAGNYSQNSEEHKAENSSQNSEEYEFGNSVQNNEKAETDKSNKFPEGYMGDNSETSGTELSDHQAEARQKVLTEVLINEIEGHERLYNGCCADIKIRYMNGEEYTVIKRAKLIIPKLNTEAGTVSDLRAFIALSDVEQLFLSSALADLSFYEGTKLITAGYANNQQSASEVGNYRPVIPVITQMGEEELVEKDILDHLFFMREKLEERLVELFKCAGTLGNSSLLEGGFRGNTTDGYWIYE